MADQEINIKLNGIAQIRSELKALKGELANATDPKQMAALGEKAGALSDQLKDANEQAAIFASGSRFEQTSNAFGLMKSQLMDMDFEGAATSAKLFAGSLGKIDSKTISASLKGLGSTIASVGGAFLKLGAQLLLNPIFLLVTIIGAVVAAFVYLGNKLGWFDGIVKMLTAVFKPLVDLIKSFLDLLGLTNFAAEESMAKTTASLEEEKEKREQILGQMDNKIALMEAEGKSTVALRIERNKYMQEEIANQTKLLEFMDNSFLNQTKLYKETVKANKSKTQEIKVEEIKLNQEVKAEQAKAAADYEQFLSERLAARRLIQDIELGVAKDGIEKELLANKYKYDRMRQDLLTNKKLTDTERIKLDALYVQQSIDAAEEITKKYVKEEKKKQDELNKVIKDAQLLRAQDEEDFAALYDQNTRSAAQLEEDAVREKYFNLITLAEQYGLDSAELKKRQEDEIAKIEEDAAEKARQKRLKEQAEKIQMAEQYAGAVNNLAETVFTLSDRFGKQDEISKEKRAKRMFAVQKAMQLSLAIIDGFKAAQASIAQMPPVTPLGIAALVATISASVANVAKIASTQYGSKSSGGGGGGGTDVTSMAGNATVGGGAPSFSLFGQGNNQNTTSAAQDVQSNTNQLTVKAIVVESDVTSTQNKVKKMQENATL
jgi:hypothetical protein